MTAVPYKMKSHINYTAVFAAVLLCRQSHTENTSVVSSCTTYPAQGTC